MKLTSQLIVSSFDQKIFSGLVKSIRVLGIEGELGIYPGHSAFLTIVKPGMLHIVTNDDKKEYIYIYGGILEVQRYFFVILSDFSIRSEELDEENLVEVKIAAERYIQKIQCNYSDYWKIYSEMLQVVKKLKLNKLIIR